MKLFFIALVPAEGLKQKINLIKKSFSETYKARHALKLPPHLTLIPPFKIREENKALMVSALNETAGETKDFDLYLDGYGGFAPRVIFIRVANFAPVKGLYERLYKNAGHILPEKPEREFHPHITIATRDLSPQAFEKAMPVFEEQEFKAIFRVKSIFLFGHTGKTWEIIEELPFK